MIKLLIILGILVAVYLLVLNPSQKDDVQDEAKDLGSDALGVMSTFVKGGVEAVKNQTLNGSGGGG